MKRTIGASGDNCRRNYGRGVRHQKSRGTDGQRKLRRPYL